MDDADFSSMLTIGICGAAISALALVLYQLGKAPEGLEDELGFHILKRTAGSKVTRSLKRSGTVVSLRSAGASR